MANHIASVHREIAMLHQSLRAVERFLPLLGPKLERAGKPTNEAKPESRTRKLKLSPQRRAQLKLRGQYMGYLGNLKPKQKTEVERPREKKGMAVATRRAQSLMEKEKAA